MPHRPRLPRQLLGEIGQDTHHDRHKGRQFTSKAQGRKEARKEKRQSKKHKQLPQSSTHGLTSKEVEEALKLARAKKESQGKRSKQETVKPQKKRRTIDPENILSDIRKNKQANDEDDAKYYAKKLGLKSLKLPDGDDGLGDLLGDLDDDHFSSESEQDNMNAEEARKDDTKSNSNHKSDLPWSSDDSLSGSDFDSDSSANEDSEEPQLGNKEIPIPEDDSLSDSDFDDDSDGDIEHDATAEDTMDALRRMKSSKQKKELSNSNSIRESQDGEYSGDDSDNMPLSSQENFSEDEASDKSASGENISNESSSEDDQDSAQNPYVPPGSRYIPPSQRKRQAMENDTKESEISNRLRRQLKGSLNKLAESNIGAIVNEIEVFFQRYPRGDVTRELTETIITSIGQQAMVQETFLITHAGIVGALYRTIGMEFCAEFIQSLVEKVESLYEQGNDSRKETMNLLLLLVECYALGVVSSVLIYGLVRKFVKGLGDNPDLNTELLLSVVRHCGSQLRSDDPSSLKSIILLVQESLRGKELSERTQFLVECIVNLKNNRQKPVSETVMLSRQRVRKFLSTIGQAEALQVSLDDILSVPVKGKWWIVGAAWRGHGVNDDYDQKEIDSIIDNAEPDWLELAKQQRLNTDVRRAIFVALMGAENFLDACQRIDKLALRSKQEREIVHVLLHCCSTEETYNPFYALVAAKQCTKHSMRKTFQFRLWDFLGQLEGNQNTRKAMHYARFYATLVADGALTLDLLKSIDFLTATGDVRVFLEIFLVTLYQKIGKYAEVGARRSNSLVRDGAPVVERNGQQLAQLFSNTKEKSVLRGIHYIQPSVLHSPAVDSKKARQRVEWCLELASGLLEHLTAVKSDDEL